MLTQNKKSFNLEPDVKELFARWKLENPNLIESRIINNALRAALAPYKRRKKPSA